MQWHSTTWPQAGSALRVLLRVVPALTVPFAVHLFGNSLSVARSVEHHCYAKFSTRVGLLISWDLNADFSFVYSIATEPFPF